MQSLTKKNESEVDNLIDLDIEYKENNVKNYLSDDEKIIEMMIEFPKIIERPIIVINNKAVIGRPPENIYEVI